MRDGQSMFMVDIETTGLDFYNDKILQIAALKLVWDGVAKEWRPRNPFNVYIPHSLPPQNDWASKHQGALYEKCKTAAHFNKEALRDYLRDNKDEPLPVLTGWCVSNFDVPFLVRDRLISPSAYDREGNPTGDFMHRIYEIQGALDYVQNVSHYDWNVVKKALDPLKEKKMKAYQVAYDIPKKSHDALYDCYAQAAFLNALLHWEWYYED